MPSGRFLNRQVRQMDGFNSGDSDAGVYFDGDTAIITRPLNVEGVVTGSGAVVGSVNLSRITGTMGIIGSFGAGQLTATVLNLNAGTVGSMTITNLLAGGMTGTAVTLATVGAGSANFDNLRIGSSAGNNLLTAAWQTIYTWNMPALPGVVGSTNAVVSQDVAMSGAAIGDMVLVAPIGSMALDLHVQGFCYSAANVNLRAWYTGSTGAYTPGNVPFKIVALKL